MIERYQSKLFAEAITKRLVDKAVESIEKNGSFSLSLSGGSTPKAIYTLLGDKYKESLDWSRIKIFIGDERFVAADHPDSNYKMVKESMLSKLPIPEYNIFPYDTTQADASISATRYQDVLEKHLSSVDGIPSFDLVLLGMGGDGHTASLFPDTPILESTRLVDSVYVEKLDSTRLSLTFKTINQASEVWVIVSGKEKNSVLREVLDKTTNHGYPIERVKPRGNLVWLLDSEAAEGIQS